MRSFREMWRFGFKLFDFGRNNRLSLTPIYDHEPGEPEHRAYWWLNGRLLGRYISVTSLWGEQP